MLSILLVHDVILLNFWDREGASASCGGVVCCSFVVVVAKLRTLLHASSALLACELVSFYLRSTEDYLVSTQNPNTDKRNILRRPTCTTSN
jgi:hypothetical protein